MKKKFTALVLTMVILCLASINACAINVEPPLIENGEFGYILTLEDGSSYKIIDYSKSMNSGSGINELETSLLSDNVNVVLVDNQNELSAMNNVSNLLSNKSIIYFENTDMTFEEIAQTLAIEKNSISFIGNEYERLGVAVYSIDGVYIFHGIYYANSEDGVEIPSNEYLVRGLTAAVSVPTNDIASTLEKNSLSLSANGSLPDDVIDQKSLVVYYGTQFAATVTVTNTQMPMGEKRYNGNMQMVWNTKGHVSIDPQPGISVSTYSIRMHCNIVKHNLLEYTVLADTESSTSYGVSIGDSPSFQSSWTFNPYGQIFFASQGDNEQVRDWTVTCNSNINRLSRVAAPGISCTSANSAGSRGSFTKVTILDFSIEAGSWW